MAERWIRQDHIWWMNKAQEQVRYRHEGMMHTGAVHTVKVWAPVSTRSLIARVEDQMDVVTAKVLAVALRKWQETDQPLSAILILIEAKYDLRRLAEWSFEQLVPSVDHPGVDEVVVCRDWQMVPTHHYVPNKRGPGAETFRTDSPSEHLGSTIRPVEVFATALFTLVANYGAPDNHVRVLTFGEHGTIPEFINDAQERLQFLIDVAKNAASASEVVQHYLPSDMRRQCGHCKQWMPVLRRNRAQYCSSPCRQAAYRERQQQLKDHK